MKISALKTNRLIVTLILGVGLLATTTLTAQTAISNLGQTTASGSYGVGNYGPTVNRGDAVSFTTGASTVNFTGVTLLLKAGSAQGSGFHVTLNSGFGASGTTGLLATLTGDTAPAAGTNATTFAYTLATPVTLAANTTYWLQVDAFTTPANTNWSWVNADSSGTVDAGGLAGWSFGYTTFYYTNNATGWSFSTTGTTFPQFSVQYSAVPEPATDAAFLALAAMGLVGWRRRRPARG